MERDIKDLLGIWSGKIDSNDVVFNIREFDKSNPSSRSIFTIINGNTTLVEWQAKPKFVKNSDGIWRISLSYVICHNINSPFLNPRVLSLTENTMVLEFENNIHIKLIKVLS